MLKHIKRYELNKEVNIETLLKKGFELGEDGVAYSISYSLYNDIEVNVDIVINADGSLSFNDIDNVVVFDNRFEQPYRPFYENKLFHFLGFIIYRYNEFMDYLVTEGVLKHEELNKELDNNIIKKTLKKD